MCLFYIFDAGLLCLPISINIDNGLYSSALCGSLFVLLKRFENLSAEHSIFPRPHLILIQPNWIELNWQGLRSIWDWNIFTNVIISTTPVTELMPMGVRVTSLSQQKHLLWIDSVCNCFEKHQVSIRIVWSVLRTIDSHRENLKIQMNGNPSKVAYSNHLEAHPWDRCELLCKHVYRSNWGWKVEPVAKARHAPPPWKRSTVTGSPDCSFHLFWIRSGAHNWGGLHWAYNARKIVVRYIPAPGCPCSKRYAQIS